MFKISTIDSWVRRLDELMPESVKELDHGLEEKIRQVLGGFAKELQLATREEFDIQTKVLQKTRLKLEALEEKIANMESCPKE